MTNLVFILLLMLLKIEGHEEGMCPNICVCKWKGGKQTVECRNLSLTKIPESTVDSSTQVLDMAGNNLQILPRDTFINAKLQNLQKVFLKHCRLRHIDDSAFKGLSNLVELDLSHNLLTIVPSSSLKPIASLRDLILASNLIHKIENHAFHYVPNLIKLDLSHCRIETIASRAFDRLDVLQTLKINGNNLSELHENLIGTLKGLHGIEMHDNPWFCDCKMRVAKIWVTENNIPLLISPVCDGGPKRVAGRKFTELSLDEFACKPQMLPVAQHIKGHTKRNVTILCRANAIPSATIKWFWKNRLLENSSIFGTHQRIFIYESGKFYKQSELILINAQEIETNELYCTAENRAGTSDANFTIHITISPSNALFGAAQINSTTCYLIILVLLMAVTIFLLLVRVKRNSLIGESKTSRNQIVVPPDDDKNKCHRGDIVKLENNLIDSNGGTLSSRNRYQTCSSSQNSIDNPDLLRRGDPPSYNSSAHSPLIENLEMFKFMAATSTASIVCDGEIEEKIKACGGGGGGGGPLPTYSIPTDAKTIKVWQNGGVSVLPPVSTIKRILTHNRSSPDEGFQEGCGTDV